MSGKALWGVMLALAGIAAWFTSAAFDAYAATSSVNVVEYSFDPPAITISVGDTVQWDIAGAEPHTVTASDQSWDSGIKQPGSSFSRTFNAAGTFQYYCTLHGDSGGAGMAGTVVVQQAATATNTAAGAAGSPTRTRTPTASASATSSAVATGVATLPAATPTPIVGNPISAPVEPQPRPQTPTSGVQGRVRAPNTGSGAADGSALPWRIMAVALFVASGALLAGAVRRRMG